MAKANGTALKDKPQDYAALKAELDDITAQLESGDLDIEAAVRCYERGLELVKLLEAQLQTAENRIVELKAASEAA